MTRGQKRRERRRLRGHVAARRVRDIQMMDRLYGRRYHATVGHASGYAARGNLWRTGPLQRVISLDDGIWLRLCEGTVVDENGVVR